MRESSPRCPPGPAGGTAATSTTLERTRLSAAGVGDELAVDGVADATLEGPQGFAFGLALAATKTKTGLSVQCAYDPNWYPTGEKISDADFAALPVTKHDWHGDWNYDVVPA